MDVAHEIRKSRGDLVGVAAAEVGKVFTETDVEVSEAVDFLNFYPYSVTQIEALEGVSLSAKGVGLVISPWNFPVAIPAGGIAAALAAGNTVILKPASAAVLSAYRLCQCFWSAGVSKNTLQFVPCDGSMAGKALIPNSKIDFVIFTGGESTAYSMIKARPDIHLSAETGGKDATIVTAMADRDQALANVLASAFNNSGQKCSATSLLVLERELYEDVSFKAMLLDAASSLEVGSVWEPQNKIGSLVDRPAGKLAHALAYLDEGESWLLPPSYADDDNPYMLRPAIRWGTRRGDYCHTNELFGPVLSVMCAENLNDAINIVNSTGYGLTSGLESLDEREIEAWKEKLLAGNLYINRPTTGAIVLRQPFGGMGKSAIGSGKKAGGLNYITQFVNIRADTLETSPRLHHPLLEKLQKLLEGETRFKDELENACKTIGNFAYWQKEVFLKEHDHFHIRGESNISRYLGVKSVLLRFDNDDTLPEMLCSYCAAKMAGAKVTISVPDESDSKALFWLSAKQKHLLEDGDDFVMENELSLVFSFAHFERIRFLKPEHVSSQIYSDIVDKAYYLATAPFVAHGRIELMHYYIEQSVSHRYHRYGNLGIKALEEKDTPSFSIYMIAMVAIGLYFYFKTKDLSDYVLGGRGLGPGVTALSAGASDMSGWLLLGLPGMLYSSGIVGSWIAVGLIIGAYLNWHYIAKPLRVYTHHLNDAITIPDYFSNRFEESGNTLRIVTAVVILLFYTLYTSSGLVGGAKLFEATFGLDYDMALLVGSFIIVSYTFLGGYNAVSWTDFIQGILMMLALVVTPLVVIFEIGGISKAVDIISAVKAENLDFITGSSLIGILSLMAWGLGPREADRHELDDPLHHRFTGRRLFRFCLCRGQRHRPPGQ